MTTLTPKDFTTDQDVRWCPGCGDYAVLAAVRKALPAIGGAREHQVFVSGIGCAARFPYYMETYGMHSIHGRAPAFATGIKLSNPALDVWLVSGDGDLLSIGGNHTMHAMRRNVGIRVLLLNNRIYGLTKGQYSPTSEVGKITKSTPMGSIDEPVMPLAIAIAAECSFVARCLDIDAKPLVGIMERAAGHPGTAFVEVLQDCNIFNHKAWFHASQKDSRKACTIELKHGEPMLYGDEQERCIVRSSSGLETAAVADVDAGAIVVHDESNRTQAFEIASMRFPEFPEPLGVLYVDQSRPVYEQACAGQVAAAKSDRPADLDSLVRGPDTWQVT
ncbi:MAG: 2-oxoacid:ferredoxin oxidoreductase subunit beta [Phycisphaerales bacterium]|nr:2-oxoacid:ferredoxin oxidoreductase subunit beta [Phycisphaerales bacterium]